MDQTAVTLSQISEFDLGKESSLLHKGSDMSKKKKTVQSPTPPEKIMKPICKGVQIIVLNYTFLYTVVKKIG